MTLRWRRTSWPGPSRRCWPGPLGRRTRPAQPGDTILRIGVLLSNTGEPPAAAAEFRKAIAIQQTLADDHPGVTQFRGDLALGDKNLGNLLSNTGKPAAAAAEYRKALALIASSPRTTRRSHTTAIRRRMWTITSRWCSAA